MEPQKKKVGRPASGKTKKAKMSYISDEVHQFYLNHGKGNFSRGLTEVFKIVSRITEKELSQKKENS